MRILEAKQVSYSEKIDGQEYFQVMFAGERAGKRDYVLIQRVFEMPTDGKVYFECQEIEDCGHYVIKKAQLWRDRMVIKLPGLGGARWEIRFEIEEEKYNELVENLSIILSNPNRMEKETQG
jgi:hypothetical protein